MIALCNMWPCEPICKVSTLDVGLNLMKWLADHTDLRGRKDHTPLLLKLLKTCSSPPSALDVPNV